MKKSIQLMRHHLNRTQLLLIMKPLKEWLEADGVMCASVYEEKLYIGSMEVSTLRHPPRQHLANTSPK